jgi:hypothetical protein
MDTRFSQVVEASIRLELNVADLYGLFHAAFPQHEEFWWKLRLEERNHAALIRSAKEQFDPVGKFPVELVSSQLAEITEINNKLQSLIERFSIHSPSEPEAFSIALLLEQSAGEVHYQKFMEIDAKQGSGCPICKIFQQLNEDDKDHAERIKNYMDTNGIVPLDINL